MSDEAAFLQTVQENLDDDAARLVFADWLEEHGQQERSEFIRVQIDLARLPVTDARLPQLRAREREVLSKHALEAQRQRIRASCEMKGLHLANVFEDPGLSGGKPLGSRPAGGRLLAEGRHKRPVVVVARLDRLFRSVADAVQTIADFDRRGIELVAISEGFDMTNPYGRAMAQMASVFAELERAMIRDRTRSALERAMIRDRTRSAMKVKRDLGERISRHVPFGWDFGASDILVENRREQESVAWIRSLHVEGKSLREIAKMLNERGVKPKRGTFWWHSSVLRILARTAS